MKYDSSRVTFNPCNHFTRVLMQQGRVQLDADPNEQVAILLHHLQTLAADLIGSHGGPGDGFKIELDGNSLVIHAGHYYVDGILCENEIKLDAEGSEIPVTYYTQPDYPLDEEEDKLPDPPFLLYLDVWERHITYIEDEDDCKPSIREVALGGPDTATRAKVVWQVKVTGKMPDEDESDIPDNQADIWQMWDAKELGRVNRWQPANRGRLRAKGREDPEDDTNPCAVSSEARYRGTTNQLYRVEIHTGSQDRDGDSLTPTFKWSRDNGSVAAAWTGQEGDDLIVSGVPGSAQRFAAGQWVELTDDDLELRGEPGTMVKLVKVEGDALTIDPETATGPVDWRPDLRHSKVRRWDHKEAEASGEPRGAIRVEEGVPIRLENGIQIQFEEADEQPGNQYRTGDYWLIPARTATGDVEWPKARDEQGNLMPKALPPHGVEHRYAPLAVVKTAGDVPANLRRTFEPISK